VSENKNNQQADEPQADPDDSTGAEARPLSEPAETAPEQPQTAPAAVAVDKSASGSGGGSSAVGWLAF